MRGHFYRKIPEEYDFSNEVDEHYQLNDNNIMNSNIFRLNWKDVAGAVVSAVLSAVLVYVANLTDFTAFNWQQVVGIATTVGATSLLKSFGTTEDGNFLGTVCVK